jgi:DNA-binding MarR family transcriptional regulator
VPLDRAGNLLGALALVIEDRTADAVDEAAGSSASAAAALSALLHFLDGPSVDLLRQVLGLTSSGTVRLVDRLEEAGYVRRGPGRDGRSTSVTLTAGGRRTAQRVCAARAAVLDDSLGVLSAAERQEFGALMAKVLAGLIRGPGAVRWLCRMCDTTACGREEGHCPVANAVRDRWSATNDTKPLRARPDDTKPAPGSS